MNHTEEHKVAQVAEFVARQHCTAAGFLPDGSCCAGYDDGHLRLLDSNLPPTICWACRPHSAAVLAVGPSEDAAVLVAAFRWGAALPHAHK